MRSNAEKQKQKAKEMLGISEDRAKQIFQEQPDRKQQKKKELEEKQQQEEEASEEEGHVCEDCGDSFDSEQGLNSHRGQVH